MKFYIYIKTIIKLMKRSDLKISNLDIFEEMKLLKQFFSKY